MVEELTLLQDTYVVFDLETTGVDRNHDYIIQFAALKIEKQERGVKNSSFCISKFAFLAGKLLILMYSLF